MRYETLPRTSTYNTRLLKTIEKVFPRFVRHYAFVDGYKTIYLMEFAIFIFFSPFLQNF